MQPVFSRAIAFAVSTIIKVLICSRGEGGVLFLLFLVIPRANIVHVVHTRTSF